MRFKKYKKINPTKSNGLQVYHSMFIIFLISCIAIVSIVYVVMSNIKDIKGNNSTYSGNNITINDNTGHVITVEKHHIGDNIALSGTLKKITYDLKYGYNYQIDVGQTRWFLKSREYDFGLFTGTVNLSGVIIEIVGNNPLLLVENLRKIEEKIVENITGDINTGETTLTVIKTNELEIDLSSFSGLSILKNDDNIEIISGNNVFLSGDSLITGEKQTIVYIYSFLCSSENNLTDCENLQTVFGKNGFHKIVNENGVGFWKIPEEGRWMIFGKFFGYNIYPQNKGNEFISLINNFKFTDISKDINNIVLNTCKDESKGLEMSGITSLKKDSSSTYVAFGKDSNANDISCNLSIKFNDGILIGNLIDIYLGKSIENTGGGEKTILTNDSSIESNNIEVNDYLVYKSLAFGYEIWMPKNVKYESQFIKSDPFNVAGLECKQSLNIVWWKGGDIKTPGVKIYYCDTNLDINSLDNLLPTGYIAKHKNSKTFVIYYKSSDNYDKLANELLLF